MEIEKLNRTLVSANVAHFATLHEILITIQRHA